MMGKIGTLIDRLSNTAKAITAIGAACSLIIGLLISITIKVTSIANDFKKAVSVVPIVEQNTAEIVWIKSNYVLRETLDEHIKFIITEIDFMIDETMSRISDGEQLGGRYINRLVYYRDNLSYLSNKQKTLINYIEKVYEKQEFNNSIMKK